MNPYNNDNNNNNGDPFREDVGSYSPPTTVKTQIAAPSYGGFNFVDSGADTNKAGSPGANQVGAGVDTIPAQGENVPVVATQNTAKFWTIEFYKQFFDVDTDQVLLRISNTLVPISPPDFLIDRNWHYSGDDHAQQEATFTEGGRTLNRNPDLYGPFWICTTLWITMGVVSNIMSRLAYTKKNDTTTAWAYDFKAALIACLVIYLYCFVFGAIVWGIMKWKHLPATLVDTICLYGYSMFIFELIAILCMVPVGPLQWIFCIVGGLWSLAYLLLNFWHMWRTTLERNWFFGILGLVSVFHILLTLSFKFYFFNYKV